MTTLKYFAAGHSAMVLCCLLYATWWYIAFRPDAEGGLLIGRNGLIFGLTFISGLIGVMLIVLGIRNAPESTWLSVRTICILGVLSYLALLAVTLFFFHRPVTSELLLMAAWATMEIAAIYTIYEDGPLAGQSPAIPLSVVAIATIISLIAYLLYYEVDEWKAFYLGLAPLIAYAIGTVILIAYVSKAALEIP